MYPFFCEVSSEDTLFDIESSAGAAALIIGLPVLLEVCYFACNDVSGCPAPAILQPRTLNWDNL